MSYAMGVTKVPAEVKKDVKTEQEWTLIEKKQTHSIYFGEMRKTKDKALLVRMECQLGKATPEEVFQVLSDNKYLSEKGLFEMKAQDFCDTAQNETQLRLISSIFHFKPREAVVSLKREINEDKSICAATIISIENEEVHQGNIKVCFRPSSVVASKVNEVSNVSTIAVINMDMQAGWVPKNAFGNHILKRISRQIISNFVASVNGYQRWKNAK
ncbi:hypothetical protein EIN_162500 [Entamoeba invadens IP1]|uniref:START domain-containing protein n=1 Tax=Entamoeba invadens IP1 TaxID=370355 RepID=A0A0A1TYL0_ENTIV|nr:hypothetical protein EIN_162500 [Entamoeba invadens IP1]ELP86606.1 hypothetical protein EIN_162500 [Entamoeba invadens IP1]|eukprot:XP_004185952.1 hypothetical protein EIN_162500 [Entamoeba invadens IP1]